MYSTPLDTVYILFETFFVCVKVRELFEVAELGWTRCILDMTNTALGNFFFHLHSQKNVHLSKS
jgi:hypothetical protein